MPTDPLLFWDFSTAGRIGSGADSVLHWNPVVSVQFLVMF